MLLEAINWLVLLLDAMDLSPALTLVPLDGAVVALSAAGGAVIPLLLVVATVVGIVNGSMAWIVMPTQLLYKNISVRGWHGRLEGWDEVHDKKFLEKPQRLKRLINGYIHLGVMDTRADSLKNQTLGN